MMFVPTHRSGVVPPIQIMGDVEFRSGSVIIQRHNERFAISSQMQLKGYNPITLSCPYCHSDIHQNERVECKCGFVAIAQPPDIITLMKRMDDKVDSLGSTIAYCNEIPIEGYFKSIDCHYVGMLENHKATTLLLVFYINEIHWLELKEGKE